MKKVSITISFDEEKLSALKMYLEQKKIKLEDELEKSLDVLYTKNVPAGVRDFIDMKSGIVTAAPAKQRKPKPSFSSAVCADVSDDHKSDSNSEG